MLKNICGVVLSIPSLVKSPSLTSLTSLAAASLYLLLLCFAQLTVYWTSDVCLH